MSNAPAMEAHGPEQTKSGEEREANSHEVKQGNLERGKPVDIDGEFDPGSGQTLAACLKHASRTASSEAVADV